MALRQLPVHTRYRVFISPTSSAFSASSTSSTCSAGIFHTTPIFHRCASSSVSASSSSSAALSVTAPTAAATSSSSSSCSSSFSRSTSALGLSSPLARASFRFPSSSWRCSSSLSSFLLCGSFRRHFSSSDEVSHLRPSSSFSKSKEDSATFSIKGTKLEGRSAYLDNQATSAVDPRVLDAMLPFLTQQYGNAHSRTHMYGWESEQAVEDARGDVAALIGADSKEIIFTSGATESNNLAIKGVAHFYGGGDGGKKRHVITLQTEHKCVLDSCRQLEQEGYQIDYLPVKSDGIVDLNLLKSKIREDSTALVSVMMVNNEIGVIQPIKEIGKICKDKNVFFHCDAAQACGKLPIDVNTMNIDLMSISGHKMYGPKGIGALYVRRKPRVRLMPIISGGGQERGLRSGTLPTPLCVGLGAAARIAQEEMVADHEHITRLAKRLYDGVMTRIPQVTLNGSSSARYPGNLNFSFAYVEGESLLMALKEVAVSSGSACTSASLEPSYVLRALAVSEDLAHSSIRIGLGRFTTQEEVDHLLELLVVHVEKLREISPLWEMVKEGIDLKTIQWTH